jgi:hypothetical protein
MKAQGASGRAPTIVVFDGMDNCKEMSVLFNGLEICRPRLEYPSDRWARPGRVAAPARAYARHDYEVAGSAAYEYVAKRPDVDLSKVVVMGYSFGGYYASRVAALKSATRPCSFCGAPLGPGGMAA